MNFFRKSLISKLVLAFMATPILPFGLPSSAQVSIGYRNPMVASASVGRSYLESVVQTNEFFAEGDNVIPDDTNSLVFDRSTIWIVKDQNEAFSLKTEDSNPLIEDTSVFSETNTAAVARTEVLTTVVSGPAAKSLRSVFPAAQGVIESELVTPEAFGF